MTYKELYELLQKEIENGKGDKEIYMSFSVADEDDEYNETQRIHGIKNDEIY